MKNYLITTSKINGTICLSLWHEKYTDGVRRFMMPRRLPVTRRFSTSVSRKKKLAVFSIFPSSLEKRDLGVYFWWHAGIMPDMLDNKFDINVDERPIKCIDYRVGTWENVVEYFDKESGKMRKGVQAIAIFNVYDNESFKLDIYDDVSEEYKTELMEGMNLWYWCNVTQKLYSRDRVKEIVECISSGEDKNLLKGYTKGIEGFAEDSLSKQKITKGVWRRGKFQSLFINLYALNFKEVQTNELRIDKVHECLKDRIRKCFAEPNTYTLLGKVKTSDTVYMLGKQIGFVVTEDSETNERNLEILISYIRARLELLYDLYDPPQLVFLQLMYVVNNSYAEFKVTGINKQITHSLRDGQSLLNKQDTKFRFSIAPLTIDYEGYGAELEGSYNSDSNTFEIDCLSYDNINKKVLIPLSKSLEDAKLKPTKYYLLKRNGELPNILVVTELEREEGFYTKKLNVYNVNGELVVGDIIDKVIGKTKGYDRDPLDKIRILRCINKVEFEFANNQLVTKRINHTLPHISIHSTKYKASSNPYIGSFDIETYVNDNGEVKVYALGFSNLNMLSQDNEIDKTRLYYLTQDGDSSEELVLNCINDMLSPKNRDHIYYVHNLGGYDVAFILKILKKYNADRGVEYYKTDLIFRNERVLKLVVKVRNSEKSDYSKITFVDSFNILPLSLGDLSKTFDKKYQKGIFPHEFVNENTLNYVGNTPDKMYFKERHVVIDDHTYNELVSDNWSVKEKVLEYLKLDILALLEIMKFFKQYIYMNYNVQITDSLTISRLALNIFLRKYYDKNNPIGVVNKPQMYNDIKASHFGGIAEVYKPKGTNLFYYDVNSLYPFVVLNDLPGSEVQYIENTQGIDIGDLFGFFYCVVETGSDHYFGLLPARNNGLTCPIGKWEGWYFSEEIKFAVKNGYKVTVLKGYKFNRIKNVFDGYVKDLYKIKSETKGGKKAITKLLLNSLLGRFGMNISKPVTKIVSEKKYLEIASTKELKSLPVILDDNSYIVTYIDEISHSVCREHGLDYIKILNNNSKIDVEKYNQFTDVSISMAAAVTSYARIFMNNLKLDLIKQGYKIWYMDTDSLVLDKPLPYSLIGNELGQFKLEYAIKEGYFITAKTYCLVLEDNTVIIKAKGVYDHSLTLEKFKSLYVNSTVTAIKSDSKLDLAKGYTTIGVKEVKLSGKSYTKRDKVYDKKGLWIDTKAIIRCDEKYLSESTDYILVDYHLNSLSTIYNSIYPEINLKHLLPEPQYLSIIPIGIDYESQEIGINNTGILEIIPRWYRFRDWYTPIIIPVPTDENYDLQYVTGYLNFIPPRLIHESLTLSRINNSPSTVNNTSSTVDNPAQPVNISSCPKNNNKRSITVKVFDIKKNRYTHYNSIRAAGVALGINESIIRRRLKDKSVKPYFDKYIFTNG